MIASRRLVQAMLLLSLTSLTAAPVPAQSPTVEILGLRRWTEAMLADSVRIYRPGTELHDAACALVLREKLGFPDAAVWRFADGQVVLLVVEPTDSARVHYRKGYGTPPRRPTEWDRLGQSLEGARWSQYAAAVTGRVHQIEHGAMGASERQAVLRGDSAFGSLVLRFLDHESGRKSLSAATEVLLHDPSVARRVAAVTALANFARSDLAWHTIMEAMRDSSGQVRGAASTVLRAFRTQAPRAVDWRGAVPTLRVLVGGTGLMFHLDVLNALVNTKTPPSVAREVLAGNFDLVIAEAEARHEFVRKSARAFLAAAAGPVLAPKISDWRAWASSLSTQQ